jgi:hypothetical protein
MMNTRIILFAAVLVAFAACNQAEKKTVTTADSLKAPAMRVQLADTAQAMLFIDYITLKNALVASDSTAAGAAALHLAGSLEKIPGCHEAVKMAGDISRAATLEQQRTTFAAISQEIVPVMKQAEVQSGQIYVQYCPMAGEGKGAYWLSSEKLIRNPYYGDDMLECGEVKQVIE